MKIIIRNNKIIAQVQQEFNAVFPYLRLEFFSLSYKPSCSSAQVWVKNSLATLGEWRTFHNEGELVITPGMTVMELEQLFSDVFGIGAQVFRQSGKAWLETTITDNWTLEEQNRQGRALSVH